MSLDVKFNNLKKYLKTLKNPAVAYSGGVDSTFLLKVLKIANKDKIVALTANSPLFTQRELIQTKNFCLQEGIEQKIIEIDIEKIKKNPKNRCYICKKNIFEQLKKNYQGIILEGSNFDDLKQYRPGKKALLELGIKSPLEDFQLTKKEIRILSQELGLKTAGQGSFSCLATRFCYGDTINKKKLKKVELGEEILHKLNFSQFRLRIHKNLVRIEVLGEDYKKIIDNKDYIIKNLKNLGFNYITLDLEGFRSGSFDEDIKQQ